MALVTGRARRSPVLLGAPAKLTEGVKLWLCRLPGCLRCCFFSSHFCRYQPLLSTTHRNNFSVVWAKFSFQEQETILNMSQQRPCFSEEADLGLRSSLELNSDSHARKLFQYWSTHAALHSSNHLIFSFPQACFRRLEARQCVLESWLLLRLQDPHFLSPACSWDAMQDCPRVSGLCRGCWSQILAWVIP